LKYSITIETDDRALIVHLWKVAEIGDHDCIIIVDKEMKKFGEILK
jgi:hypothetical protein